MKSQSEKDSDEFVFWLFKHRCVMCRKQATEINEIEMRSRSKLSVSNWKNRVPLCKECHEAYHHDGVTDEKMIEMREKRKEYLIAIDREEYV